MICTKPAGKEILYLESINIMPPSVIAIVIPQQLRFLSPSAVSFSRTSTASTPLLLSLTTTALSEKDMVDLKESDALIGNCMQ